MEKQDSGDQPWLAGIRSKAKKKKLYHALMACPHDIDNSMVSRAIWGKTRMNEFSKDCENIMS